jgi:hypothetical protein
MGDVNDHRRLDERTLDDRVGRLAVLLDPSGEGTGVSDVLAEVRDLFRGFQAAEARHVRAGLCDATFGFRQVQERLGFLRRTFGAITRLAADALAPRLAPEERAELERIAFLAQTAPLTTVDDLAAMRAGRRGRGPGLPAAARGRRRATSDPVA